MTTMSIWDHYLPYCPVHGPIGPAGECCPGVINYHRDSHRVLNLTEYSATNEQLEAGVFDLHPQHQAKLRDLLTSDGKIVGFSTLMPPAIEVAVNVELTADLAADVAEAAGCRRVMIDGPHFMLPALERALFQRGLVPIRRADW